MNLSPYDPRAVANLLLDLADAADDGSIPISNLALQKLLYFAHGRYLIQTGKPLMFGAFEAWTFGPVHPAVYSAFKGAGEKPINFRAQGRSVMTGVLHDLPLPQDRDAIRHLRDVVRAYGPLSAGQLVAISHAPLGPWATVVDKARTGIALGLRIPDSLTVERFKYQKISLGASSGVGEPDEDTPLIGD